MGKNNKKPKAIRVSADTHKDLLRLADIERRNVWDVADRLLAPVVKAALEAAEANPPI